MHPDPQTARHRSGNSAPTGRASPQGGAVSPGCAVSPGYTVAPRSAPRRSAGRAWRSRLHPWRPAAASAPGFTLIEVLVVLVILALLAGIVTTQLLAPAETAKADATKVQIKALGAALDLYRLQNSQYPTTEQGLAALLRRPEVGVIPETWRGPYLNSGNLPVDGWKRQFLYTSDGLTFVITSLGADGAEGGTGLNADLRSTDL